MDPVDNFKFFKDPDVQDIVERLQEKVIIDPASSYTASLVAGNKRITGLSLDKYYMVESEIPAGSATPAPGYPKFVGLNGHLGIFNLIKWSSSIINLTNNNTYKVTESEACSGSFTFTGATGSPATADASGKIIITPSSAAGTITLTGLTGSFNGYEVMGVTSTNGQPSQFSGGPKTINGTTPSFALEGPDTTTDYIFVSGTNFKVLRVVIEAYNAATSTYGIELKNNNGGTPIAISSPHVFTGAQTGYGTQTPLSVDITNTGNQPTGTLTVAKSGTNSGDFTLSTATVASITSGTSSNAFTVVPNAGLGAGTYTATVTVTGGNGISAGFDVSFTVSTTPTYGIILKNGAATLDGTTYPFADKNAVYTPEVLTVTIENSGNQATGALAVALGGPNLGSFDLSTTLVGSIAVGGPDGTFTVSPNTGLTAGSYTATVTVTGSNGITASFNVSFTVTAGNGAVNVTINFTDDRDTWTSTNTATISIKDLDGSQSAALTLVLDGGTIPPGSVTWYHNGTVIAGQTNATLPLDNSAVKDWLVVGIHKFMATVDISGRPYSREFTLTVTK